MKKALIVEDFKPIAEIWNLTLKRESFDEIKIVSNSDEVEVIVQSMQPDIILMDINMPGQYTGLELTSLLVKKIPDIKIIIVSLHFEPQVLKLALDSGARGYVYKNSSIEELKKAIHVVESGEIFVCSKMRNNVA